MREPASVARIEDVTAPLVIRFGDGAEKVVVHCFPHRLGLRYLEPFWHQRTPGEAAHLVRGELGGDGRWKVGDAVIRLLGCHDADPHLQDQVPASLAGARHRAPARRHPPEKPRPLTRCPCPPRRRVDRNG